MNFEKLILETVKLKNGQKFTQNFSGVEVHFRLYWEEGDAPSIDIIEAKVTKSRLTNLEKWLVGIYGQDLIPLINTVVPLSPFSKQRDIEDQIYKTIKGSNVYKSYRQKIDNILDIYAEMTQTDATKGSSFHEDVYKPAIIA